jgi:hypothetical protein
MTIAERGDAIKSAGARVPNGALDGNRADRDVRASSKRSAEEESHHVVSRCL